MNLIDKQDRGKLGEGRNSGLGFAFCKRTGETWETVMPCTACKDYLGDQVYSELTGKPFSAYGFNSKKEGIFEGAAYLVLGILPTNRTTTKRPNHDELEKALMSPETGLGTFLSHFSDKMGQEPTLFFKLTENRMGVRLPLFWVEGTYRISLWSLLCRVGLKYREGDPMGFLSKVNDDDAYMVKAVIPKIERMLAGDIPIQNMATITNIHNMGIQTYDGWPSNNFPPKSK